MRRRLWCLAPYPCTPGSRALLTGPFAHSGLGRAQPLWWASRTALFTHPPGRRAGITQMCLARRWRRLGSVWLRNCGREQRHGGRCERGEGRRELLARRARARASFRSCFFWVCARRSVLAPPGWRRCRGRFLLAPSPSPPRHCCFHFCSLASAVRIRTGGTQRRGAPTPPRFSEGRVGRVCWRGGADSCLCAPSAATARGFFAGLRFSLLPLFLFFGAAGCLFAGSAPSFCTVCVLQVWSRRRREVPSRLG